MKTAERMFVTDSLNFIQAAAWLFALKFLTPGAERGVEQGLSCFSDFPVSDRGSLAQSSVSLTQFSLSFIIIEQWCAYKILAVTAVLCIATGEYETATMGHLAFEDNRRFQYNADK